MDETQHLGRLNRANPFRESLLGRPAWIRLLGAIIGLVLFWFTVAWAVAVP